MMPNDIHDLEARRTRAWELFRQGVTQAEVARRLATTRTSTSRWHRDYRQGKPPGSRPKTGRTRRLSESDYEQLRDILRADPDITAVDFQAVIFDLFEVRYHRDHALRIRNFLLGRSSRLNEPVSKIGQGR